MSLKQSIKTGDVARQEPLAKLVSPAASPVILQGTDFRVISSPKRQASMLLFGDAKTGKSTFCLRYAPDPIAFINYDGRAGNAAYGESNKGRRIYFMQVDYPANVTKLSGEMARRYGQDAINKTIKNYEWAIQQSLKGNVRTICLDTGTEYSEMIKLAITGRVDRTKGDYGTSKDLINREWWRVLNLAREGSAHLIVLARAKAIWVNNEPTGKFTFRGPEVMADGVDFCAQIRLQKQRRRDEPRKFEMEITAVGVADIGETGAIYKQEDWEDVGGPFVYACTMQYPGSTFADWE